MDVVITTAQVPGRKPPVLVTADAVEQMKPGSVIVDMAASALGGNCELSQAGETIVTDNGVTIIAPGEPAGLDAGRRVARSTPATSRRCCSGWSRTARSTSTSRTRSRRPPSITHGGEVVSEPVNKLLNPGGAGVIPQDILDLLNNLTVFILAILVGFAVISKVPATLHTPLMSGANSIHGIVLVGAMLIAAEVDDAARLPARASSPSPSRR